MCSSLLHRSVARACANLTTLDQGMIDAVETRQELDLRIGTVIDSLLTYCKVLLLLGCAFTRFQTIRLRNVFPQILSNQLISYGPCQFPTLGFVVDRVRGMIQIAYSLSSLSIKRFKCLFPRHFIKLMSLTKMKQRKFNLIGKGLLLFMCS